MIPIVFVAPVNMKDGSVVVQLVLARLGTCTFVIVICPPPMPPLLITVVGTHALAVVLHASTCPLLAPVVVPRGDPLIFATVVAP